eukprot:SAG31_NODE_1985_length_6715_cov_6.562924_6_plen_175_part_00
MRVLTEDGLEGYGEVEALPEVAKAIIDAPASWGGAKIGASGLRAQLLGENALDIDRLWEKMYRASSFYGRHAVVIQAMAGIDMALHDLAGKFLQVSHPPSRERVSLHFETRSYSVSRSGHMLPGAGVPTAGREGARQTAGIRFDFVWCRRARDRRTRATVRFTRLLGGEIRVRP